VCDVGDYPGFRMLEDSRSGLCGPSLGRGHGKVIHMKGTAWRDRWVRPLNGKLEKDRMKPNMVKIKGITWPTYMVDTGTHPQVTEIQ
jgi:hypothetical protein